MNFLLYDFFDLGLVLVKYVDMMLMELEILVKHNELGCSHVAYLVAMDCKIYILKQTY